MWIDKFYEKYKYTPSGVQLPVPEPSTTEPECDIDRLRKILPSNYFNVDMYKEDPVDYGFLRKNGFRFIASSIFLFILGVYMLYHCHRASCSDCLVNLHKFPCDSCKSYLMDTTPVSKVLNSVIPYKFLSFIQHSDSNTCSLTYCIFNNFWNLTTHYEKCYYSNLVFNTIVWLLATKIIRWLAMIAFKHSIPNGLE